MTTINTLIQDLTIFYVKTNYENYLIENKLSYIEEDKIPEVVNIIYNKDKQSHLVEFVINSSKELLKDEFPGENIIKQILVSAMSDDELCKNKLITEIKIYQNKNK